jgi:hypothetical protein
VLLVLADVALQSQKSTTSNSRNVTVFNMAAIQVKKNIYRSSSTNEHAKGGPPKYNYNATSSCLDNPKAAISETVPSVSYRYRLIPKNP